MLFIILFVRELCLYGWESIVFFLGNILFGGVIVVVGGLGFRLVLLELGILFFYIGLFCIYSIVVNI